MILLDEGPGNGIRIRNDTVASGPPPFNPLDLVWDRYYDYSEASSVTLNGATIAQVDDLSGNGVPAVQATGSIQPLWDIAAPSGLRAALFDGAGDRIATAANWTRAQPFMVFVALQYAGAAAGPLVYPWNTTAELIYQRKLGVSDAWGLFAGTPLNSAAPAAGADWHVHCALFDGASSYLMIDGVTVLAGGVGATNPAAAVIVMGARTAGGQSFPGSIGQWSVGPAQTDTDRDAMTAYLMDKWL